jgi:DNA recombination protein RmuC
MSEIILVLLIVLILILLFVLYRVSQLAQPKNNDHELLQALLVQEMSRNKEETIEKMMDKLGSGSNTQTAQITETKNKIDLKFQELQALLNLANQQNSQNQKSEFLDIKLMNQQALSELQKNIQESLSKAISDLTQLNTQSFGNLQKANQEKLDQINNDVQKKLEINFAQHLKSFEEVSKNVGQVQTLAQSMIQSTTSIDKLNSIFSRTSSKSFGDFGESYLESLLNQYLTPDTWAKQFQISGSAEKIDFMIRMDNQEIGIDSKFPLTRYNDFLHAETENKTKAKQEFLIACVKMADDISKKYSKHGFAHLFMYLPSDGIYNEIISNNSVLKKMQELGVTPISPVTIFPILMNVKVYNYRQMINQNAEQIVNGLSKVGKNILAFQEEFRKLGDKLRQAQANYDIADRSLVGVHKEISMLETSQLE